MLAIPATRTQCLQCVMLVVFGSRLVGEKPVEKRDVDSANSSGGIPLGTPPRRRRSLVGPMNMETTTHTRSIASRRRHSGLYQCGNLYWYRSYMYWCVKLYYYVPNCTGTGFYTGTGLVYQYIKPVLVQ